MVYSFTFFFFLSRRLSVLLVARGALVMPFYHGLQQMSCHVYRSL